MESDFQRTVSSRVSRRADRNQLIQRTVEGKKQLDFYFECQLFYFIWWFLDCLMVIADGRGEFLVDGKLASGFSLQILWRRGLIRLLFVAGIICIFLIPITSLFHIWSCQSSVAFFSGICFVIFILLLCPQWTYLSTVHSIFPEFLYGLFWVMHGF